MKKMSYAEAIREGMSIRMREDPSVLLFGEDVGAFGGCFGVTAGMFDEFGDKRVRDTPISEGAIIGAAVGSAATGLRPIAELMFCDFLTVGMDQLVNQAAKMRYMFGGKVHMPLVVRAPFGAGKVCRPDAQANRSQGRADAEHAKQKRHRAGGCNHGGFGVGKAVLRENIRLGYGKGVDAQSAADRSISVQPRQTAQARCRRLMARPPILVFSRKFHSYTVSISKTGAFVNNSEKKEQPRRFSAELFSLQVRRCHADACGRTQSGRGCR